MTTQTPLQTTPTQLMVWAMDRIYFGSQGDLRAWNEVARLFQNSPEIERSVYRFIENDGTYGRIESEDLKTALTLFIRWSN